MKHLWTSKTALSALGLLLATSAGRAHAADQDRAHFQLSVNPKFADCVAQYPGDPSRAPRADVTVTRGKLNDILRMQLRNIKPNLGFDLFTVERTALKADGTVDPTIPNRGLAWYQSDVEIGRNGTGTVEIRTILLDQIFGFDPIVGLQPVNTFHVGIWFDNPDDAVACDPTRPVTPFNGDHKAGPLAMISVPDATTGLGPLCINPNLVSDPVSCNP